MAGKIAINYLEDLVGPITIHRKEGISTTGQDEMGYGKKIHSGLYARFQFKNNSVERKIYTIIFSNSGSLYINFNKKTYYLKGYYEQSDIRGY